MNFSCNFDAVKAMLSTIKDNIVAALPFWCKTVLQAIVLSFLIRFCFFIELHFRLQIAIEKLLIVLSGFFYYDLLLMASIFVIAFIPYVFLQKLSPKTNQVIIQGILGLYTITTALLAEYYCEVSRPLDQVVFAYSPQELWSTVIASTQFSFVTIIFLCLYIVAWYGSYRFRKIMKPTVFFSGVMLTLSCTAFALFRCKSIVRSEKGYVLHSDFYLAVNQVLYTYIKITDYTQADEENVSLYLTLTTHEPFLFDGIEPYEHKVITMCDADTSREADIIRNNKNIYATYLYTDNALHHLLHYYSTCDDFQNTIFIITGDHRMAFVNDGKNHLRKYNVPLIIYSPLLKQSRRMESVVSHYDIAPSVTAYLKKNYSCKFPETTHYLGESLDTTLRFVSKKKQLFMLNNRAVEEWIHDTLYLYNDELYVIRPNLDVKWYENDTAKERMKQELAMFQSLSVYTVDNNYLRKPISNKEKTNDN